MRSIITTAGRSSRRRRRTKSSIGANLVSVYDGSASGFIPEAAALVGGFVGKSQRYPAESRELKDAASGRRIRQITSHPSIHHHPFFFVPAYDQAMRKLIFVSYRTGRPQIFFED